MRLKKIIKEFVFENGNRSLIELGVNVRLHPTMNRLQLKEDSNDEYPTTADLYAKTWAANPESVKQWLGFEAVVYHPKDNLGVEITSAQYRLGDGTDEYWWNGAAWVIDNTSWNTEAEVATNISSFPATSRKIQVVANLITTDKDYTPYLYKLKILYASNVEFQEDILYKSFLPMLRSQIRTIGEFPIVLTSATDTIDLTNDYVMETPYNVVGIDSVFNHTDDSEHDNDLYQSFNVGTKVITLTSSQDVGKTIWIRFIWEPEVAVTTSQEYVEVGKAPALMISSINYVDSRNQPDRDGVANKSAGTVVIVNSPLQVDIELEGTLITTSARDQSRLGDEIRRFLINNRTIRSVGLDEIYRLMTVAEYANNVAPGQNEIHSGVFSCKIVNALFYLEDSMDGYVVQNFNRSLLTTGVL